MDSFAYGYNFGLMYQLTPCTRLGVTYRSRLKHDFEGRAEVTGPNTAISLGIDTNLKFADYVLASVYHKVNSRLALLANLGWDNWSVFDRTVLTSDQDGQLVLPRNWKDTWHAAIGVEYQLCCPLLLQAGFSYDSSPTDAEDRTPDLPMDHQFHFATGLIYQSNRCERFSLGLEYLYGGPGKIDKVGPGGQSHLLKGDYPHANLVFLNFSYNRKM